MDDWINEIQESDDRNYETTNKFNINSISSKLWIYETKYQFFPFIKVDNQCSVKSK